MRRILYLVLLLLLSTSAVAQVGRYDAVESETLLSVRRNKPNNRPPTYIVGQFEILSYRIDTKTSRYIICSDEIFEPGQGAFCGEGTIIDGINDDIGRFRFIPRHRERLVHHQQSGSRQFGDRTVSPDWTDSVRIIDTKTGSEYVINADSLDLLQGRSILRVGHSKREYRLEFKYKSIAL